jgi:heme A synthase
MIFKSHLFSMILYAVLVAVVLALLRRDEKRAQLKYGIYLVVVMVGGAILFGWLMYLFTL